MSKQKEFLQDIVGISNGLPIETWSRQLQELREQALTCHSCGLSEKRNHVVFGEGNPESPLVLVGEGPGETEDHTGRPFVGRAGQILDRALSENQLSRQDVFICNIVKCRACDWREGKAFNRPPSDQESAACRSWLNSQLGLIAPKVILCIGAPSAKTIIKPNFKITAERGKYFPCDLSKTAIATLHPAYILRQSTQTYDGGFSLLVADIAKAWEAAQRLDQKSSISDSPQEVLF